MTFATGVEQEIFIHQSHKIMIFQKFNFFFKLQNLLQAQQLQ